ncbi:MAG: thiamine phosphate synthase [Leptolyngbyaceae bacterium]|nr:thiamine phosphate synthase [Leptolyngbyaceae bacterium]
MDDFSSNFFYESKDAYTPALCRILDANLDRAREGIRTIEDWCRFGLNEAALTEQCKSFRQELARWHTPDLRAARDTPGDLGTDLSHPQEETRTSLSHVLQANFSRVEEALRVLEEYGKLYQPEMGQSFKRMRYQVYTLESQVMGYQRMHLLRRSPLYLVTSPQDNLLSVVESALKGGLTLVQYRDKHADDVTRIHIGTQLRELCHRYGALFIMNDRADLAKAVDADGVHLGQQDIPIALARQILGPSRIVGRSTTNPDEMGRALAEGADYIGVGPVYETPTKEGKPAAGHDYVRYAAAHATVPWYAIGGIDTENLREVCDAGAGQVAVVRAIMHAEQPSLITQYFLSQLQTNARGR